MEEKFDDIGFPSLRQLQRMQKGKQQTHDESDKNLRGKMMRQQVQEPREQIVSKCRDYINIICEKCGEDGWFKRPLKVAILGKQGCGKSSFINSLAASLSRDKWIEYTTVGYRNKATPITDYISQHKKCCNDNVPMYRNVLLPTLLDVPGLLEEEADERIKKFLRLLFYGHIQSQTAACQVFADCTKDWDDLQKTYSTVYNDMKVDRVIFVASAVNDKLPHRLMECVMSAARPPPNPRGFKRQIPVYGVLTNLDKVDDENREKFERTKEEFKRALGLHEGRILCCSNYCDDADPDNDRFKDVIPSLDLPILEFFSQVCERKTLIIHPDDRISVEFIARLRGAWRRLSPTKQAEVATLFVVLLSFVVVYVLHATLLTSEQDSLLRQRCKAGDHSVAHLCSATTTVSSLQAAVIASALAKILCQLFF